MGNVIQFRELKEDSTEGVRAVTTVIQLYVEEEYLGRLYLDPGSYTIAWEGSLDFRNLHNNVFDLFTRQTLPARKFFFHQSHGVVVHVLVSLILLGGESHELVEFKLDEPLHYEGYVQALNEPDRISFARYDVQLRASEFVFNCTFTAENAHVEFKDRELAIQMPRPLPVSKHSLEWILNQHFYSDLLSNRIDVRASAAKLSELISSRYGFDPTDQAILA